MTTESSPTGEPLEGPRAPGAPPGTLTFDPEAPPSLLHAIAYGPGSFVEREAPSPDEIDELNAAHDVMWLHVEGLGSADTIRELGSRFQLHALALEDVLVLNQRAKVEAYDGFIYVVLRAVRRLEPDSERLDTEQVSLFIGDGFVLSFEERADRLCFGPVRERLRNGRGRLRSLGPDYLAYALIDTLVDYYFPVLEAFGEHLEELEDEVLANPCKATIRRIHSTKRQLVTIRRAVWPLREALSQLVRDEFAYFTDETRTYLRDCLDHTLRVIDLVEVHRETASSLVDMYLSSISNRMNEIMKVLTIISTIFIPLGFIAGLYGMNFDPDRSPWNMPELRWAYGYPFVLGLMGAVAAGLVWYFVRKGWVGGRRASDADA